MNDDAVLPTENPHSRWAVFMALPAWLVSFVVHLVLLIALAMIGFSNEEVLDGVFVTATVVEEEAPLEQLTELEIEPIEEPELDEPWSMALEVADPGAMTFQDLGMSFEPDAVSEIDSLATQVSTIDEIGNLFRDDGVAMSKIGEDWMRAANFFGQRSKGRSFVFVVDNSNSMTKGRFETALNELMRTIDAMSPQQEFYIIFFSDTAYRLFHPYPAAGLIKATEANKRKVRQWLGSVQMCLRTEGREAIETAISLQPDVIYILGDGVFTDNTLKILTAPHQRSIPIHTVGMEVDSRGESQMKAIAAANHGQYRLVSAAPAAVMMARQHPVPRNVVRGPVWGLKLPLVDTRKKKRRSRP